ncbi:hypothetical protein [Pseudomonas hamedanensis]|uniref:Uncharacterized protein n=1 Tax=Pseudomonas hamedanensis TaxID=2745504 RepID=A0A9E6P2Z7_9PSED|nr:hypothetical protein [Pseudomonas hamedanensis]QXI18448.1 hypothetical protein HU739_005505 [Pseudomonas hamedanensis]
MEQGLGLLAAVRQVPLAAALGAQAVVLVFYNGKKGTDLFLMGKRGRIYFWEKGDGFIFENRSGPF